MNNHDAVIWVSFYERVGDIFFSEKGIEIFHLVSELLDVVYDDQSLGSHLRECEKEVVEVFTLHRVDEYEVEVLIWKSGEDRLRISEEARDETICSSFLEVDLRFIVGIPRVFDSCDRSHFSTSDTRPEEC